MKNFWLGMSVGGAFVLGCASAHVYAHPGANEIQFVCFRRPA